MPVGLGQVVNQRLDAVKRIGASATGFADNLVALLDALAFSTRNPFGTAALRTAGSAPGNVPFLDADGRLAAQVMPRAEVIDAIAARALASDLIALRDVVDDKAPLAAPVFTGSPARTGRIPTTDVSENLATTRFVAALIAAASTGSVTLPAITIGTEGTRTGNAPASAGDVFVQYGGTNPGLYVAQAEVIAAWVAGTAYAVGARVIQGGAYYRCTTANSDTTFTAAHWDVIAKPYVWSHVATTPRALQTVATLSATAAVGEAVLKTGAGTGLYIALAANEWTRMQERPTPVATLPSNPAAGDIAIKSGAGQGLYICVVAGTWIGVQGVDTGTAQPATGDLGSVFALQGAPAGQGRGGSVLARLTATDWYRLAVYGKDTARIGYNAPADIAGSADGDLYIRIGSVSPGLYQRVSGSWVAIAGIETGTQLPATAPDGELFVRTAGGIGLFVRESAAWRLVAIPSGSSLPAGGENGDAFLQTTTDSAALWARVAGKWVPTGRVSIYSRTTNVVDWSDSTAVQAFSLSAAMTDFEWLTLAFTAGSEANPPATAAPRRFTFSTPVEDLDVSSTPGTSSLVRFLAAAGTVSQLPRTLFFSRSTDARTLYMKPGGDSVDFGKMLGIWGGPF